MQIDSLPMKEKDIKEINFVYDDKVENIFTDLVQLNVNHETVKIKLAVKDTHEATAQVSHVMIMTMPHFLRFAKICHDASEKLISDLNSLKD